MAAQKQVKGLDRKHTFQGTSTTNAHKQTFEHIRLFRASIAPPLTPDLNPILTSTFEPEPEPSDQPKCPHVAMLVLFRVPYITCKAQLWLVTVTVAIMQMVRLT